MVPTITNPFAQLAGSALLAALLLCLSAAVLSADEGRTTKTETMHCRMYFGCLPSFTKMRSPIN